MARIYQVTFENVTVSAAQDLVLITGAAGKMMKILRMWLGHSTSSLAAAQMLRLRARFLPSAVTAGTGGTTGITPSRNDPGDAACSSTTAGTNNTTVATTSGTAVVRWSQAVHLHAGLDWTFGQPPPIGPSEAFVFELLAAPTGTVAMSGGVEFQEEGG